MALQPLWTLADFSLSYSIHSRYDSFEGGSAGRKAATYTQNNTDTQTSMSRVGLEPPIPAFERAKTVYALDHAATAIASSYKREHKIQSWWYTASLNTHL
jgi:hypothetical protein